MTTSTLSNFPEFLSSQDLVSLGLFSSTDAAYVARIRGNGPAFLKMGKKVVYYKASLLQFIESNLTNGPSRNIDTPKST